MIGYKRRGVQVKRRLLDILWIAVLLGAFFGGSLFVNWWLTL